MDVEEKETQEQLEKRMRGIMNQSKVVLFMKGSPETPRCGFSRRTVALLQDQDVEFTHFDILSDEDVRAGKLIKVTCIDYLRPQGIEQLAYIPATYHQWRVCWWFGHYHRDG